ncbi:acyl-CoA binding protein [Rhizodiscina lignyota]|uniref:Acyl-CoA binding protein n=1 Tax=Rhizodiscina lignyota TaxID=1504668 RepID=A0A9P4MAL9_9PEZI|nr:acyl-CoA binding protein [Rhizodiscina lignyota]
MPDALYQNFLAAKDDSEKLSSEPSNDDKLKLYALYKIGKGDKIEDAKKPGMFDMQRKYMYNAWQEEVKAGTAKADAQKKYIEKVNELATKLNYQTNYTPKHK